MRLLFVKVFFCLIFVVILLIFVSGATIGTGWLPQIGEWSARTIIYQDFDSVVNIRAQLETDPFGNLHLMWYREDESIMYSRWDGSHWTVPTDILLSPSGERTYRAAFTIDDNGGVHVVWGNNKALYYSFNRYDQAGNVAAWATPVILGPPSSAYAVTAKGEQVFLVYSAFGGELYSLTSQDGGITWGEPIQISQSQHDAATDEPRVFYDQHEVLHVVWNSIPLPNGYPPSGIFYAQSTDQANSWSLPIQLDGEDMGQPNVAVAGDDTIHVVWNGRAGVGGRFHTWSADRGRTWQDIETITLSTARLEGGLTHPPSLTVDSSGTLHILFTTNSPGAIYTYWTGNQLVTPQLLVSVAEGNWWNEQALLYCAFGNQLHLIVMGESAHMLWHSWATLNVEAQSPLPTPQHTNAPSDINISPTATPFATVTPDSPIAISAHPDVQTGSGMEPVLLSLVPAMLVVIGVVTFYLRHNRRL